LLLSLEKKMFEIDKSLFKAWLRDYLLSRSVQGKKKAMKMFAKIKIHLGIETKSDGACQTD